MNSLLVHSENDRVVQHNALVNARFNFTTLETRLFLALLVRINREDDAFSLCDIPISELGGVGNTSSSLYEEVNAMTKKLTSRVLHIEVLKEGRRQKQPDRLNRPLMARCDYIKSKGVVRARFNEEVREYLLELKDNFTQAQIPQLLLIRSSTSHRIYWLIREYAQQQRSSREIEVTDLRNMLGMTTEYVGRWDSFKLRVLDRAQVELANTDLPITIELVRKHRAIFAVRFCFPPIVKVPLEIGPAEGSWQALLLNVGVAAHSLPAIEARIEAGDYSEEYIRYTVSSVNAQVAKGKVSNLAGAVFKSLSEGYLLPAYEKTLRAKAAAKSKTPAKSKFTASGTSIAGVRKRLLSELDDAQGSMRYVMEPGSYKEQDRAGALKNIEVKIADLFRQLGALDA